MLFYSFVKNFDIVMDYFSPPLTRSRLKLALDGSCNFRLQITHKHPFFRAADIS
jgi:hypothetical protein